MIGFHGKNIMNGKRTGKNMKTKPSGQFNPSINRLLSFILSISILLTVAAPFAEPQTIEANWVTKTVGALIASLVLNSGAPNIETDYINYLKDTNNSVMQIEIPNDGGVTSLPSDLASQIDTAIQTAPLSVQRSLQPFETTAADVAIMNHALSDAGADTTALNLQTATVGENIAASAQELQNTGNVNPSFGGQAFSALQGIISGGAQTILGQKIRDSVRLTKSLDDIEYVKGLYDNGQIDAFEYADWMSGKVDTETLKTIANGASINTPTNAVNQMFSGGGTCGYYVKRASNGQVYTETYFYDSNIVALSYTESSFTDCNMVNLSNQTAYRKYNNSLSPNSITNNNMSANSSSGVRLDNQYIGSFGFTHVGNYQEYLSYIQGLKNGTINKPQNVSPSLVGANGQLTANVNVDPTLNLNYYTTNEAPIYNYNNYNMEPVDLNEYTQFAQSIQQQIGNDTPQEEISEAVEQYVSQHLVAAPIPTAAPPPPVVPDQPTPDPKPTGTPEQQQENEEIMATPELKDKFPFCIPWDIYYAFAVLEDQREAPALDFDLDLGPAGSHHIEVDFSEWEDIASLLRLLELLAFIIGLAIATKHLMGGTGA